jgi:hypothetical protein
MSAGFPQSTDDDHTRSLASVDHGTCAAAAARCALCALSPQLRRNDPLFLRGCRYRAHRAQKCSPGGILLFSLLICGDIA